MSGAYTQKQGYTLVCPQRQQLLLIPSILVGTLRQQANHGDHGHHQWGNVWPVKRQEHEPVALLLTFPPTARLTLGVLDVVVSPLRGSLATSTVMSMLTEPSTRIVGGGGGGGEGLMEAAAPSLGQQGSNAMDVEAR